MNTRNRRLNLKAKLRIYGNYFKIVRFFFILLIHGSNTEENKCNETSEKHLKTKRISAPEKHISNLKNLVIYFDL